MVYVSTKLDDFCANVGKYSSIMEHMGNMFVAGWASGSSNAAVWTAGILGAQVNESM